MNEKQSHDKNLALTHIRAGAVVRIAVGVNFTPFSFFLSSLLFSKRMYTFSRGPRVGAD